MLIPLALKAVLSKNGHTTAALLIVAILAAELVAIGAVADAYLDKALKTVEYAGLNQPSNSIIVTPDHGPFMEYDVLGKVSLNADVAVISPELIIDRVAAFNDRSTKFRVRCVKAEVFSEAADVKIGELNGYAVYVGRMLADLFNLSKGQVIWLTSEDETFKLYVKGVFETQTPLDGEVLMGLETAWRLWLGLKGKISLLRIRVKKPCRCVDLGNLEAEGFKILYGSGLRPALRDLAEQTYKLMDVWSIIVCGLIFTTSYVSGLRLIEEAKWEYTLLRALGLSKRSVLRLIVYELLLICVLGLALGLALGVSGTYVACTLLKVMGLLKVGLRPFYTVELLLKTSIYVFASTVLGGFVAIVRVLRKPIASYVR